MSSRKRQTPAQMKRAVEQWNSEHPPGTHVRYWPGTRDGEGKLSQTMDEARVLGAHTAGVTIMRAGFVALSHVEAIPEPAYYILDTRSAVGNCALWWRPAGAGYTCNLDEAGLYSFEEAKSHRVTDVPIHRSVAEGMVIRHVRLDHLREGDHVNAARRQAGRCSACDGYGYNSQAHLEGDGLLSAASCPACDGSGHQEPEEDPR